MIVIVYMCCYDIIYEIKYRMGNSYVGMDMEITVLSYPLYISTLTREYF